MIRFLLFPSHRSNAEKSFSAKGFKRLCQSALVLFIILLGQQASAQIEVDTWYSADRAINTPSPLGQLQLYTPLAPADGTPVTTWHDLVDYIGFNTLQHAVQHPNPLDYPNPWDHPTNPGFQHSFGNPPFLIPAGSIPGIPTLRRNQMNFNPSVEFDGSGNGQALHTRPISREEITVFIVFKARGRGNSANTQQLLYGGDIDNYHSSTTNLSLGVSDNSRFSVGRTWNGGSFFQSGAIDLQNLPTIGVFSRDVVQPLGTDDEILTTKVNGLPDINFVRHHPTSETDLYLFSRLGKHFNSNDSNRNLTGHIAEVLIADGVLTANSIQRIESYLAIKYGITLNSAGSLGSTVGNQGYQYLAANGAVIWDPAVDAAYRFDIAGLARDRYQDNIGGASPDLRYNLHQRIAKSENDEAIVTMSTDSNFSGDNLDQTRPEIDNTTWGATSLFSYLHNYLLWGNDHASLNSTNVELPPSGDITERISREWKIQKTVSPGGVTPITGVSVQVDLSGSDILTNPACGIQLMIDRDGDGDFTTGVIDYVTATSVVGTDAFFDNVDFEHLDVFTIGFGDFTDPTATDPDPIIVCDTVPAPDPNVVDDEDDNCAVLSVTHISDVSDGLSNPETITRTYRVTDTSGNTTDVTQIISLYTSPEAGAPTDMDICEGDANTYDLNAQLAGADAGGTWTDVNDAFGNGANSVVPDPANMDFSALGDGSYGFTYTVASTGACPDDTATVSVNINNIPIINVDLSSDPTTCGGSDGSISLIFGNVPNGNHDIFH
ncbi:hypothetical protein PY092_19105, partial [Muricauda sp. 334s03]